MKRAWLIVPWALFLLVVAGWVFYWYAVAGGAEQKLAQWADGERARGAQVTYGPVQRHGFPVLMRLELDNVHYRAARAQWSVDTPRIDLNIEMLDPGHVIFASKAPMVLRHADGATNTINADTLVLSLHSRGATLVQDGIEAANLSITDSAKPGTLHITHATMNLRPDPAAPTQYQLALTATDVTLARPVRSFEPFGQNIASIDAGIVIAQGALLFAPSPTGDMLEPWRHAGGGAHFGMLALKWGPLDAQGQGDAGLDDLHRLTGHLKLRLNHPGDAVSAMAQSENIPHDAKQALQAMALGLMLSNRHISFDVDAADGQLKIENASLRTLDPLY